MRIGISLEHDRIVAVATRGQRLLTAAEERVSDGSDLVSGTRRLLGSLLRPRLGRPSVYMAVGPSMARTKVVEGLPATSNPSLLRQVLQQEPGRFFLADHPLAISNPVPVSPGAALVAAFSQPEVEAVRQACEAEGFHLCAAIPAVILAARRKGDGVARVVDGEVAGEATLIDGELTSLRWLRLSGDRASTVSAPETLPTPEARYSAAYLAATLGQRETLVLSFPPAELPSWRMAIAAAALVASLFGAVVLPLRGLGGAADVAQAGLDSLAPQYHVFSSEIGDLNEVTAALREVAEFGDQGSPALSLLGAVERILPDSSVVASVRADTAGGTLTILSPRVGDVLVKMESVPGIDEVALSGPVTREAALGKTYERGSVRFRWRDNR